MIRYARQTDMNQIRTLWESCFPDEGGFNSWYFEHLYQPGQTLVQDLDGELAAMVQMIPFDLQVGEKCLPVTYIYGACTAPQYRRRHLMAELLEESFRLDRESGKMASVLIPQEEWLFGFYEKFGYEVGFRLSNTQYQRKRSGNTVKAYRLIELIEADISDLSVLYEQIPGVKVVRTSAVWENQLNLFQSIGFGAFGLRSGEHLTAAAFCWKTVEGIWVQELLAETAEDGDQLSEQICAYAETEHLTVTHCGNAEKLGCIKFYQTKWENGYMNLMYN